MDTRKDARLIEEDPKHPEREDAPQITPQRRAHLMSYSDVVITRRWPAGSRMRGSYAVYAERQVRKVRSLAARKVYAIHNFPGGSGHAARLADRIAEALRRGEEPELPPTNSS